MLLKFRHRTTQVIHTLYVNDIYKFPIVSRRQTRILFRKNLLYHKSPRLYSSEAYGLYSIGYKLIANLGSFMSFCCTVIEL